MEPTESAPHLPPAKPEVPKVSLPMPAVLDRKVTPAALRTYAILRAYIVGKLPDSTVPGSDAAKHPTEAELQAFRKVMTARGYNEDQFALVSVRSLIDETLLDDAFRLYVLLRFSAERHSKGTRCVLQKSNVRQGLHLKPGELQRLLGLCQQAGYVSSRELQGGFLDLVVHDEPQLEENHASTTEDGQKVDTPQKAE